MDKRTSLTLEQVVEKFPKGLELKDGRVLVKSRPRRPMTNVEFVRSLMEHSQFGALAQLFVLDALDKWSQQVAASTPSALDTPLISGHAWHGVAKEIQEKINARTAQ
jgi:hypothetical protein